MTFSPEQRDAQDVLQTAIEHHVRAFSGADVGGKEIVADWVACVELAGFNERGERTTAYHLIFSGGEMPDHRAVGLFSHARDLMRFGDRAEPDDYA